MGNAVSTLVGDRLRIARLQRRLTSRELGEASGIAVNTISLIERGKISPTVATLHKLSLSLGVPLSFFFEQDRGRSVVHHKAGQRDSLIAASVRLENLGSGLPNQTMEPLLLMVEPGADSGALPMVHVGHELVFVLTGCIDYWVAEESYRLERGDSLLFEAHLPHRWLNVGEDSAQVMLIIQAPQGVEAARMQHLEHAGVFIR